MPEIQTENGLAQLPDWDRHKAHLPEVSFSRLSSAAEELRMNPLRKFKSIHPTILSNFY